MSFVIRLSVLIGLVLSFYALYVEYQAHKDPDYIASCDIASWISCSKVFTSKYAHTFPFMPNAAYGVCFYLLVFILDIMRKYKYIQYVTSAALLTCCYLAYVLMFILHDMCVVCVSTWIVNVIILISASYSSKSMERKKY